MYISKDNKLTVAAENKFKSLYSNYYSKKIPWQKLAEFLYEIKLEILNKDLDIAFNILIPDNFKKGRLYVIVNNYFFLKENVPDILDEDISQKKITKLRVYLEKHPEIVGTEKINFIQEVLFSDDWKKYLNLETECDIKFSANQLVQSELLVRLLHVNLNEIIKSPSAVDDLRHKLGMTLHELAVCCESIFDPEFMKSQSKNEQFLLKVPNANH